jgi:membrane protein YdbS with pleckstrin-like domain
MTGELTRNPLAVYAPNPEGVSFENQENGEKLILLLRQHLVTQLIPFLEIIFLALVPLFIAPVAGLVRGNILPFLQTAQLFWALVFWYLFVFGFAFYKFVFWYFNVYLVTSERVIDFDFKGILHMETAYANLNKIQDVTPKIIGFGGTFFHYGNVLIQTAGEKNEFEFVAVERPDDVAQAILDEVRNEESEALGVVG